MSTPMSKHRPAAKKPSPKKILAGAQARSLGYRGGEAKLPKPPWEQEEQPRKNDFNRS